MRRALRSQSPLLATLLGVGATLASLACASGPEPKSEEELAQEAAAAEAARVGLVAQGESFSNLVPITENLEGCDDASSTPDGKVVFACFREQNWDLYLKNAPTGGAVQRLTDNTSQELHPAVSPDGSRLAFSSDRTGNFDIYIMSLRGGSAIQHVTDTTAEDNSPSWSPDGNLIAFTRFDPKEKEPYIWIKNLSSNANIQLTPGVAPQFSPDGQKILFQRPDKTSGWFTLWTTDLNAVQVSQVVAGKDWGAIDASWSPDGQKILFVASKGAAGKLYPVTGSQREPVAGAAHNLWVANADGSAMTQLTTHPRDDIQPHWSAQNHIYFTSWRDTQKRIWRFSPILPDNYKPRAEEPPPQPVTPPEELPPRSFDGT